NNQAINGANSAWIHHNYLHDNVQYGFLEYKTEGSIVEDNESSNDNTADVSASDQGATKFTNCINVIVRSNLFHDSQPWGTGNPQAAGRGCAIWFDHVPPGGVGIQGSGCVAEYNIVQDCHQGGIEEEVGPGGMVMRHNLIRRNHGYHIMLSNAQYCEVHDNVIAPNGATTGARGLILQMNTNRTERPTSHDHYLHHNMIDI